VALLVGAVIVLFWWAFTPLEFTRPAWLGWYCIAVLMLLPLHEMAHGIIHPRFGVGPDTTYGVWPSRGLFYAYYAGALSRERTMLVIGMPFLALTMLPLAAAILTQTSSWLLMLMGALNSAASCADFVVLGMLLFRIRPGAIVCSHGWRGFVREDTIAA